MGRMADARGACACARSRREASRARFLAGDRQGRRQLRSEGINGMDKLIITDLGTLDGTYEFDVVELITLGGPDALDMAELHRVKNISGVRAGELLEAI